MYFLTNYGALVKTDHTDDQTLTSSKAGVRGDLTVQNSGGFLLGI
jgi:hypothetical protein